MALNLTARFFGDTSPLIRSIKGVKPEADKAGSDAGKAFGSQFKSVVLRFIGAGAIISQVQKIMQEAVKIESDAMRKGLGIDAAQELQRAIDQTGLTLEEIKETAPMVAKEFVAMMESIKDGGGFLDKATVESLSDAAYELNRFTRDAAPVVSGLTWAVNQLIRITKTGVWQIAARGLNAASGIPGLGNLKFNAIAAGEMSNEFWNDDGSNRPAERTAVSGFMGARRSALESRSAFAGSLAQGLPMAGNALQSASGMVPFAGSAIGQIVDELRKSNTKLDAVKESIQNSL